MTARPFSRLEPVSKPDDPARAIATFFVVVAGIGAIPAAYWTLILGVLVVGALADAKLAGAGALLGVMAYAVLGFAQLRFYAKRSNGKMREKARGWWLSTYFYNLVPLGISVAVFVQDPHIGPVVTAIWFATLCTLSIVAYGADRASTIQPKRPALAQDGWPTSQSRGENAPQPHRRNQR